MAIGRGKKTTSLGGGWGATLTIQHPSHHGDCQCWPAPQLIPPEEPVLEEDKDRGGGENPSMVCACTNEPGGGLLSQLSPPGPIPPIYLQIKGLFSFPRAATARQTW